MKKFSSSLLFKSLVKSFAVALGVTCGIGTLSAFAMETPFEESTSPTSISTGRIPKFQFERPNWGVQAFASLHAFGGGGLIPEQGTNQAYAISFLAEYQPAALQSYGIFGIGPIFEVFPIFNADVTTSPASLWALGGNIRYQARYFREQPIVPVLGYTIEYFSYRFNTGVAGNMLSYGPTAGIWILLNFLESRAASNLYVDTGILRSYLTLEYRNMRGNGPDFSYSGGSYYFGLRCEF